MIRIVFIIFLFIPTIALAQNESTDYYPIKIGYTWKYRMPDNDFEEKFVVSSFDDTYDAYLVKHITKVGDLLPVTNEQLLEKRNGKVLLLGSRGGLLNSGWIFNSEVILSSNLRIGLTWKNEKGEGEIDEYEVINFIDDSVKAGQFKNVLVLQKTLSSIDLKLKKKKILLKTKEYFAPGVGLIKTEVLNSDKNTYSIFTELVEYEQ